MKKLKLFFACLLMAVLSIGQVWSAEELKATLDFTSNEAWQLPVGSGNGITTATDYSDGTYTINLSATTKYYFNADGYLMIGKSGSKLTLPAFSWTTTKIVVVGNSNASKDTKQNIYVGETAVSTETTSSKTTQTYNIAAGYQAAGNVYSFQVTSNHNAQVTRIEIYGEASGDEPGGDEPGGDEPGGDEPEPQTGDSYELVTNVANLAEGDEIIIVNEDANKAISTTQNSNNRGAADVTASNDVITPGDDVQVLTLGIANEHWTLYTGSGYLYAAASDKNYLKTQTTNNANGEWTISISDEVATLTAQGTNTRNVMQYNEQSAIFACYGSASQKDLKIFKKVNGTVLPSAELAYAEAGYAVKLDGEFTVPTLSNPHEVAVTYASDNTDVAEVNATTGAVTIKAVGVAKITASFAGNEDYKEGSASYKIGVTTHAGKEADPYVAADAKIAIDAAETIENAYATGIVSNVVTTTLPEEGYISFYFSADGNTTGQQIEAYHCFGLNSAQFEAVTDVETGATVVITGTLKKFNTTYEFDQNCHLVSYEAPATQKQSIANDQANPYTVAQALEFAADGVTYDLDDYVYVQGVVYDVKSFNNGAMNIFIKDANAENQFEFYACAGINDGNATTAFEALTDVQAGNIVIGYGQMMYFKQGNIYEFKAGNYLVDLQKPVTGVELDKTEASVEEEAEVTLTATILPANATGTIVWTVESGSEYASVEDGVVTGVAEGEATIRATVQGTEIYAECTVTVTAAAAPLTDYYEKVTSGAVAEGTYLIVYEDASVAFDGGLETLDAKNNYIEVAITNDNKIGVTEETAAATFYIDPAAGTIQAANGKYIGVTSNSNGLKQSDNADAYQNAFAIDEDGNAVISAVFEEANMTMRYNKATDQNRFRYFGSGQQPIALYKLANEVLKSDPELAWNKNVEQIIDAEFTSPTLSHADGITGTITYESDNTEVATVTTEGVISLTEPHATGTAHITASYPGDDNFKAGSAVCTIKINPAHSIFVDKLKVDFGPVDQDAELADQKITVTLTNVEAATATLGGTNPEKFNIDPAALTASGDITISVVSTAEAGTFTATLTISDDASEADSKVVNLKLIVNEPEDDLSGTWVLATAVPEIGKKFIVAGTYNDVTKTMGIQNANNRAAVVSSLSDDVLTPGEGTKVFTLVDAGEGKFAIQASNGKYLTASGTGTKNYLTEAADYEAANAQWTISISEGIASVVASSSNRNNLQYNKSNPGYFSCYSGDQTAIQFYVLQEDTPEPPTPSTPDYTRPVEINRYGTICLPQAGTISGAKLFDIEYYDAVNKTMYLLEVNGNAMEAGHPYIFLSSATSIEVTYTDDATAPAGSFHGLVGSFTEEPIDNDAENYIIYNNELYLVNSDNVKVGEHRAYIHMGEELPTEPTAPAQQGDAPRRRVAMSVHGANAATGMENVQGDVQSTKVLINGHMYILRGEKMFDATGRMVK